MPNTVKTQREQTGKNVIFDCYSLSLSLSLSVLTAIFQVNLG